MPIKKSAIILLIFATSSIGLLAFACYRTESINNKSGKIFPLKCSSECSSSRTSSPWNMASYTMRLSEG